MVDGQVSDNRTDQDHWDVHEDHNPRPGFRDGTMGVFSPELCYPEVKEHTGRDRGLVGRATFAPQL